MTDDRLLEHRHQAIPHRRERVDDEPAGTREQRAADSGGQQDRVGYDESWRPRVHEPAVPGEDEREYRRAVHQHETDGGEPEKLRAQRVEEADEGLFHGGAPVRGYRLSAIGHRLSVIGYRSWRTFFRPIADS